MARTYVRRRRTVALLVLALAATLTGPVAHAVVPSHDPSPAAELTVVVRPGDTAWAIARRVAPSADPREVVAAIASRNGIDPGRLVPGQSLVVPVR